MRKIASIFVLLFASGAFVKVRAQNYYTAIEVGLAFGGSQYFGDLNDNRHFNTVAPAFGVFVRRHLNPYISIKACVNYTQVGYDDKYNSDLYSKQRNLNFTSQIYEAVGMAEFNFFRMVTGDQYHRITPYLTGGIGGFYYDPYTTYNGTKYYLRGLGTEGQFAGYANRKYSNYSLCFPLGVGVKFWIAGGVNMTIEVADRLTRTDYLDDVSSTYVGASSFAAGSIAQKLQDRSVEVDPLNSLGRAGKQRGNTASYDQYMIGMVTLSWHFKTYQCPSFMSEDLIRAN